MHRYHRDAVKNEKLEMLKKRQKVDDLVFETGTVEHSIVKWIATTDQPLSMVEEPTFRDMLKVVASHAVATGELQNYSRDQVINTAVTSNLI